MLKYGWLISGLVTCIPLHTYAYNEATDQSENYRPAHCHCLQKMIGDKFNIPYIGKKVY